MFTDLSRKAKPLRGIAVLAGWLYRHTFFVASSTVRAEQCRSEIWKPAQQNDLRNARDAELEAVLGVNAVAPVGMETPEANPMNRYGLPEGPDTREQDR